MRFTKILLVCLGLALVLSLRANQGSKAAALGNLPNAIVLADGGAPLPPPSLMADGGAPLPPPLLMADGGAPLPPPSLMADGGAPLPPPAGGSVGFATVA